MIKFHLNGDLVDSSDAPDTPLLWVVRDTFRLKGSKFGCGAGLCGACTMHVDGQAVRTCVLPVSAVANKQVTTIEGLGNPANMSVLQKVWSEQSVPQCGYCQSGQIMSATALLKKTPKPTEQQVDQAMSGNLCRCGCYPRIKKAILSAAQQQLESSTEKEPSTEIERNSPKADKSAIEKAAEISQGREL